LAEELRLAFGNAAEVADPASQFEPLRRKSFPHVHDQSRDQLVPRVLSTSIFATLSAGERHELGDQLRTVVPDTTYLSRLRAEVWWTRLR
jgi:hypothetical protein